MASIVERISRKTGKVSYRVHIKRHSRYLKTTGMNNTLTKTFHTRAEAEFFAASQEEEMLRKASKYHQVHMLMESGPGHRGEIDKLFREIHEPEPKEIITRFSQIIRKYAAEVMVHKALNTQLTQRYQLQYWDTRLGDLALKDITTARLNEEKVVLFDKGYKSSSVRRYLVLLNHILQTATNEWQLL